MDICKGISVIIPTYQRNSSLKNCLYSILNQSQLPNEIIVIDNSPDLTTKKVVERIANNSEVRIKYLAEKRKGSSYARNKGIDKAQFDVLVFIDDDCQAKKDWLKQINLYFQKNKRSVALIGKSINGYAKNFFAVLEQYSTNAFFNHYVFKSKNKCFSLVLDTKNCALRKSNLIKKKILFDHLYTPASTYIDIDFGVQLIHNGCPIIYLNQVQVAHYGKTTLWPHLTRNYRIGKGAYLFQRKWGKNVFKKILKKEVYLQCVLFSLSKKQPKKRFNHTVFFKKKSVFYQIAATLIILSDKISQELGYNHMRFRMLF